jgi:hypothetical protein
MAPFKRSLSKAVPYDMARLGPTKLKNALTELEVEFNEDARQAELQALWMLSHLDMLDDREALLPELTTLWGMTMPQLVRELSQEGLEPAGKKWDQVKLLLDHR